MSAQARTTFSEFGRRHGHKDLVPVPVELQDEKVEKVEPQDEKQKQSRENSRTPSTASTRASAGSDQQSAADRRSLQSNPEDENTRSTEIRGSIVPVDTVGKRDRNGKTAPAKSSQSNAGSPSWPIVTGIAVNAALAAFTALVPKLFKSSSTHFFSKHPLKVAVVFGMLNMAVAPDLAKKVLNKLLSSVASAKTLQDKAPGLYKLVNQIPQPYSSLFTLASVTAAVRLVLTTKSTRWLAHLLDYAQKMAMILAPLLRMAVEGVFVGIVLILVVSWAQGLWAHVPASTKQR